MRVLRVISSMNPKVGGPCQGIRNIVPYLQQFGIENEVVCLDDYSENYGVQDNFNTFKIGNGKTNYQYNPQLLQWLKTRISNYDAVIVHGLWQYPNYAVFKAIKQLKNQNKKVPKVIIMPHGMLDPYFQKASDRKWKAIRNELLWAIIEKKCINAADAVFFTCEEEMNLAKQTFQGYYPQKTVKVGYGIKSPPIYDALIKDAFFNKIPQLINKKYWLFLSRIHEKKGVDILINAYMKLVKNNPDLPDLVIAGPLDSGFAESLQKVSKSIEKIHFPGMLKGNEKWGAFYNCVAYLLPSHQENFGIAIVEAMACKKPVIITKNVNIWSEIEDGGGGIILENTEISTLADELLKLGEKDDCELQQIGEKAYKTFEQFFDVKDRAAVFAQALKDL